VCVCVCVCVAWCGVVCGVCVCCVFVGAHVCAYVLAGDHNSIVIVA